jgi:hypothetical protein
MAREGDPPLLLSIDVQVDSEEDADDERGDADEEVGSEEEAERQHAAFLTSLAAI